MAEAAAQTNGFSGRELAKMVASVQTAVYGGREAILTADLFRRVVLAKVCAHSVLLMSLNMVFTLTISARGTQADI